MTKTIRFYDNAESFFHGFAMGLLNAGVSGLDIVSNRESAMAGLASSFSTTPAEGGWCWN
ncbi:MAG: hypothetical protein K6C33_12205 [Desulfovibrio sp.]|nr:hypothetical protein [Desulfovibrio sp.]